MLKVRRFSSTSARVAQELAKYSKNDTIHNYTVSRVRSFPEWNINAIELIHSRTGSQHLHIASPDTNNVFCVGFKTNPPDKTGVAHILEHTTLCGSKNYPIRDPFFKMLNRSLSNYMNAMTGQDYTIYPFATTNEKDYRNLQDVYLDSTFNALLKREDFTQEGWRIENENINDKDSKLIFKGVVYNEMKGQVSNSDYYFWVKFLENIYPDLNNSGGDPDWITTLQYEQLQNFYKKNYHPSNSKTFSYGNFTLEDTLKRIDEKYSAYENKNVINDILLPIDFLQNQEVVIDGNFDVMLPEDKQTKISVSWKCGNPRNIYETFKLTILTRLLTDGHSSPMYKGLIESGIGMDYSVNTGLEGIGAVNFLNIGVQGVSDIDSFKKAICEKINSATMGFDNDKVEGILRNIELNKKEPKSNFGMEIMSSVLPGWFNGIDPFEQLKVDEIVKKFRIEYTERGNSIFNELIQKYIINKPKFTYIVKGNKNFPENKMKKEEENLAKLVKGLNTKDHEEIFERGKILQEKQNVEQDISCLPSLKVKDIDRIGRRYPILKSNDKMKQTFWNRITNTNGLTYLRAKKDLNFIIPFELYEYLPLFTSSLTHIGTTTEEYSKIENEIRLNTGGISVGVSVNSNVYDLKPTLNLKLTGWSLNDKSDSILKLWRKVLLETDFVKNADKLKILLKTIATNNGSTIVESGHSFANKYSSAHHNVGKAISESMSGISQVRFINIAVAYMENDELFQKRVIDKLVELQKLIIGNLDDMQYLITSDSAEQVVKVENEISQDFENHFTNQRLLIGKETSKFGLIPKLGKPLQLLIPSQGIAYSARTFPGAPYAKKEGAALQILSQLLTTKVLHKQIREQGGAYGGGATYNGLNGIFAYYSYRDPNPSRSLKVFKECLEKNNQEWRPQDLEEAKLSVFQSVDAPMASSGEGVTEFMYGIDGDLLQQRREQLLDITASDVRTAGETFLKDTDAGVDVVLGSKDLADPSWEVEDL